MTVTVTRNVSSGSDGYVPWHTASRDSNAGLVGTLAFNAEATGDSGGGTVKILLRMRREEFGFPILWVPTQVTTIDNLATAEDVIVTYETAGNRRLSTSFQQIVQMRQVLSTNAGAVENVVIPIEGVGPGQLDIMQAEWATNTDTKTYHLHMFGPVYDLQMLARLGQIDPIIAGLR